MRKPPRAPKAALEVDLEVAHESLDHVGFADIRAELKDIRQRIDAVELAVQNISGFAKEIDHLIERVSAIEQHLGLRRNIAA